MGLVTYLVARPCELIVTVELRHIIRKGELRRIPEELIEKIPRLSSLGKRCPGARLCFRTDSQHINIKLTFDTLRVDKGMSMYSCQSMMVYCGDRQSSRFIKLISPKNYDDKIVEGTAIKEKVLEDVVIWLPRNEPINDIEISIDDDAQLLSPTSYKYPKPILYYGTSITEGGCADLHDPCDWRVSPEIGNLCFINKDGSLRPYHKIFNEF